MLPKAMAIRPPRGALRSSRGLLAVVSLGMFFAACSDSSGSPPGPDPTPKPPEASWAIVHQGLPGALLSLWGTSSTDVWAVGGDKRDGSGPLVLHYDGATWKQLPTGEKSGDLWWVFGFPGAPIFMGGAGGVILRYEGGAFTKMTTPGTDTVFGMWGDSPTSMWAVGGSFDTKGFAWRLQGDAWIPEPSLPAEVVADASIWKVTGRSASDVWLVGSKGASFRWTGTALEQRPTGVATSLFTAHGNAARFAAVGGLVSGVIVENESGDWKTVHEATYGLTGIFLGPGDTGYAVGQYGSVYARDVGGWHEEDTSLSLRVDLHSVWMDPSGGVWAVGGRTSSFPLTDGILLHKGESVTQEISPP